MMEGNNDLTIKLLKCEIRKNISKIKDSLSKKLILKEIIKRVLTKVKCKPTMVLEVLPVLIQEGHIYITKLQREKEIKKIKKQVEMKSKLKHNVIRISTIESIEKDLNNCFKRAKRRITEIKHRDEMELRKENERSELHEMDRKPLESEELTKKILKPTGHEMTDVRVLQYVAEVFDDRFVEQNKMTKNKIIQYIDGLKTIIDSEDCVKCKLFSDKEDIFMQITCFKIPISPTHQLRLLLPRMMFAKEGNTLLFVKDIARGSKNIEKSEEYYKGLLLKHNVKFVSEVMCFTRLKNEYDQYETKRKLLNSYDTFLVDGRIAGHIGHVLGKIFIRKRKLPIPIKMDSNDLNEEIQNGLRRTALNLHATGDCFTVRIGTSDMKSKHIAENFIAVCSQLAKLFPGGWDNIRFIRIKTPFSIALPIFVSLKDRNKVKVPVVNSKRPKAYQNVGGELSTLLYCNNVIVSPEGRVTIKNKKMKMKKGKQGQ